jgi:predicted GNAT family acetyltransferase
MLRKLTEKDRQSALEYLSREPSYNVFTIGDIENFGFVSDFQEVWGDFNKRNEIRALMLRYYDNYIVYSATGDFDESAVCDVLSGRPGEWMLSGKASLLVPLAVRLGLHDVHHQVLAELRTVGDLSRASSESSVEWATLATFEKVIDLQSSIEEFHRINSSVEAIRHTIKSGTGRTVFVRQGSEAVSSASSAAENSSSAMIIGVCTAKEYRHKGLATICMTHLCNALLDQGKVPCLFYENPKAARIYKRIGFRDVGRWTMAKRKKG